MTTSTLHELAQPSEWKWLGLVVLDWLVIAVAMLIAAWLNHPAAFVFASVTIAVKQHALAILAHDGAHRLVSRTRWLNDVLTNLFCFWPLGFPLEGYRRFHFQHHRLTGTPQDPELIHKRVFKQWEVPTTSCKLSAHVLSDLLGGGIPHLAMAAYLTRAVSFLDGAVPLLFWLVISLIAWQGRRSLDHHPVVGKPPIVPLADIQVANVDRACGNECNAQNSGRSFRANMHSASSDVHALGASRVSYGPVLESSASTSARPGSSNHFPPTAVPNA